MPPNGNPSRRKTLDSAGGFDADAWGAALDGYYGEYDTIGTGPAARSAAMLLVSEGATTWEVRQIFDDPEGDHDWGITAIVDLAESNEQGLAVVRVTAVGPLTAV